MINCVGITDQFTSHPQKVIFTDLDGTLLDHDTYSWEPARPALDHLRRHGVPWLFVTSKTRAEVEVLRQRLHNQHPFIVENGGAAFIPRGYFPFPIRGATTRNDYDVIEWGEPYDALTGALEAAARETGCHVQSFHDMTVAQTAAACDLPLDEAVLAKQREYDEPFTVLDPQCESKLLDALAARGLRTTLGGRFLHVCGNNDKAVAVRELCNLFNLAGGSVTTIGLGDGWNDLPFLEAVDTPVIVRSRSAAELKARLPRALLTGSEGPAGWNQAVLDLLA
jgi:mannosyl-3-phosphoglycerate phosphatase